MSTLEDDLEYLRTEAFEFTLELNAGAGCFDTVEYILERHPDADDWVNEDQRLEFIRTGKLVSGQVYPCGSVTFFTCCGTRIADVVAELARCCREERARWARAHDGVAPPTGLRREETVK